MVNVIAQKYNGFVDQKKVGKFRTIQVRGARGSKASAWVKYIATFSRKSDLDRAKKWYQSHLVNHLRTYKTAGGYELWVND